MNDYGLEGSGTEELRDKELGRDLGDFAEFYNAFLIGKDSYFHVAHAGGDSVGILMAFSPKLDEVMMGRINLDLVTTASMRGYDVSPQGANIAATGGVVYLNRKKEFQTPCRAA